MNHNHNDDGYYPGSEVRCDLCDVTCGHRKDFEAHKRGKKHRMREIEDAKEKGLYCELCGIFCTNNLSLIAHKKGKKHILALQKAKGLFCEKCDFIATSRKDMELHKSGSSHRNPNRSVPQRQNRPLVKNEKRKNQTKPASKKKTSSKHSNYQENGPIDRNPPPPHPSLNGNQINLEKYLVFDNDFFLQLSGKVDDLFRYLGSQKQNEAILLQRMEEMVQQQKLNNNRIFELETQIKKLRSQVDNQKNKSIPSSPQDLMNMDFQQRLHQTSHFTNSGQMNTSNKNNINNNNNNNGYSLFNSNNTTDPFRVSSFNSFNSVVKPPSFTSSSSSSSSQQQKTTLSDSIIPSSRMTYPKIRYLRDSHHNNLQNRIRVRIINSMTIKPLQSNSITKFLVSNFFQKQNKIFSSVVECEKGGTNFFVKMKNAEEVIEMISRHDLQEFDNDANNNNNKNSNNHHQIIDLYAMENNLINNGGNGMIVIRGFPKMIKWVDLKVYLYQKFCKICPIVDLRKIWKDEARSSIDIVVRFSKKSESVFQSIRRSKKPIKYKGKKLDFFLS